MTEVWKPIPDFPGYEVSDHGRVRSYHRRGGKNRWFIANEPQRILLSGAQTEYKSVNLHTPNGKRRQWRVHQLVALTFLGPCPDGLEVCHLDGNAINNNLENLRYDTRRANVQDAIRHGVFRRSIDVIEVEDIRKRYANGVPLVTLAEEFNVSSTTIFSCVTGKTYKEAPGPITPKRRKVSDKSIRLMKSFYTTSKYRLDELALMFGISYSYACRIINGNHRQRSCP